ncbi:peptidoglycan recognition protein family protein [Clostridium celatum]|uniref:N-acetylmuramoyl-L-alanine amidase n=1 Tax=Clostridium celatum DSM 1785 TaxID=545697 RepID=L1QLP5_9CLOT|nr:peptidoglycan recognition family protein [Clostridium celatum]EKY28909.1 N-acetylmuramoyl-L-alanine amidase [Clostridium celatum DSM 1785]MCE9655051.1 peptidoglycan recognition protein family protein [Clostridium celatum]
MEINIKKVDLKFNEELIPLNHIENIIIHHTHNPKLTVKSTHEMHIERFKWAGIGYNYFIEKDGEIFEGRGMYVGAHAKLHNHNSIGIALAGNFDETKPLKEQMDALINITLYFMKKYDIETKKVLGHRELEGVTKTCPGKLFSMDEFRLELQKRINK